MLLFRDDHLTLDKQSMCTFLVKTTSSAPSFAHLPVVLCVGLRLHGILPVLFNIYEVYLYCVTYYSIKVIYFRFYTIERYKQCDFG